MKKLFAFIAFLLLATPAMAETIVVGVDGLVCSFCAIGIEEGFKDRTEIQNLKIDLNTKSVTLETKEKATMDDNTIKQIISDAGFTVNNIQRAK